MKSATARAIHRFAEVNRVTLNRLYLVVHTMERPGAVSAQMIELDAAMVSLRTAEAQLKEALNCEEFEDVVTPGIGRTL